MIRVKRYTPEDIDDWNSFIEEAKNAVFQFNRSYMDYHSDRFVDHSLMILKKDKIVGVLPANEVNNTIVSHGGLSFGSLVISFDFRTAEVLDVFNQIKTYYLSLNFTSIIYKSIPFIFHSYPAEEDLYALFRLNAKLVRRDISSVIRIDEKLKFSESKKQAIKKCVNNQLCVAENEDFSRYWELLESVLLKFDTKPVHTLEEITKLKHDFPKQIKLYEARKQGEIFAGLIIYDYQNVVHTQYMANSQAGRKLGALDFINAHLIEKVYSEREYYSFGISTEDKGRYLNTGLIQQKEMMGARGITVDTYEINLSSIQ